MSDGGHARFRVVRGTGTAAPGAIASLIVAVRGLAVSRGMQLQAVKRSRCSGSPSAYMQLLDKRGRLWLVRISNHYRPHRSKSPAPHIDLVSIDGTSGLHEMSALLARVADGQIEWHPIDAAYPRRAKKARRS